MRLPAWSGLPASIIRLSPIFVLGLIQPGYALSGALPKTFQLATDVWVLISALVVRDSLRTVEAHRRTQQMFTAFNPDSLHLFNFDDDEYPKS